MHSYEFVYVLAVFISHLDVNLVFSFLVRSACTGNSQKSLVCGSKYNTYASSPICALINPTVDFNSYHKEKFDFKLSLLLAGFSFEAYNDENVSV